MYIYISVCVSLTAQSRAQTEISVLHECLAVLLGWWPKCGKSLLTPLFFSRDPWYMVSLFFFLYWVVSVSWSFVHHTKFSHGKITHFCCLEFLGGWEKPQVDGGPQTKVQHLRTAWSFVVLTAGHSHRPLRRCKEASEKQHWVVVVIDMFLLVQTWFHVCLFVFFDPRRPQANFVSPNFVDVFGCKEFSGVTWIWAVVMYPPFVDVQSRSCW